MTDGRIHSSESAKDLHPRTHRVWAWVAGSLLLASGAIKLVPVQGSPIDSRDPPSAVVNVVFRVLRGDVPGVLPLFSWVEIALGLAIVYPRTRRPGLTLGSALLMCYGAALVIVLRAGSNVSECRCLGAAIALDPTGHMLVLGGLLTCVGYATVLAECDGRVTFR